MRIPCSSSPGASAFSNAPVTKSSTASRRATAGARDHALRAERAECRDPVRGRIGMAHAATNGTAVAHRPVGNAPGHHRQGLQAPARQAAILDVRRRNAGTERHRIGAIVDFRELRNAGNVHQDPRLDQTQIEHRPKRLRACHHSRSAIRFKQNRGRLGQRARAYELEDGRFHSRINRWGFARSRHRWQRGCLPGSAADHGPRHRSRAARR